MGSSVVLGKVNEPHCQEFLRGHNEEINIMAVSKSGKFIASGQQSSTKHSDGIAPIFVWEVDMRKHLYTLEGFNCPLTRLSFSPDDHFLIAAGLDSRMILWDMSVRSLSIIPSSLFHSLSI